MFALDTEQRITLRHWMDKKDLTKYGGAIGGRFTYSFTPTSLGVVTTVSDSIDKDEINLTDYESW